MLVMVVFFIAFRWIHLSTPLIRLFLLVLLLLLMPTLNFLTVWFALREARLDGVGGLGGARLCAAGAHAALHRAGPLRDRDRPPQRLGSDGDGRRRAHPRAAAQSRLSGRYATGGVESAAVRGWSWLPGLRVSALLVCCPPAYASVGRGGPEAPGAARHPVRDI